MDPVEIQMCAKVSRISSGIVPYGRAVERHSAGKIVVLGGGTDGLIDDCAAAYSVSADVTVALVAGITGNANQFTVAGAFTTGLICNRNLAAVKDLSGYSNVRALFKSSVALAAGVLQIGVSETAGMLGSPVWQDIPAVDAGKWYLISVPFTGVVGDRNAVLSVGLNAVSDPGACVLTLEDVSAGADFKGIEGFSDNDAIGPGCTGTPVEEYAAGKDVPVIFMGHINAKLAAGNTCVSSQRLYPVPGGELVTTEIVQGGPGIWAKEDQATAGGRVGVRL